MLMESFVDLAEERETTGGVRVLKLDIETAKKASAESLSYSIYSPIFLFLMVISILKIEYTLKVVNVLIIIPFSFLGNFRKLCKKKSNRNKPVD